MIKTGKSGVRITLKGSHADFFNTSQHYLFTLALS